MKNRDWYHNQDLAAAIYFVAAHFASVIIFDAMQSDELLMRLAQCGVYIIVSLQFIDFKLRVAAWSIALVLLISGVNFFALGKWPETAVQYIFYASFASIINTIDLIVLLLLGRNGGIHLFNFIFKRRYFFSKA